MHKISAAALAVLLTATTGLAATAPALAQPPAPPMGHHMGDDDDCDDNQRNGGWHGRWNGDWNGGRGDRGGRDNQFERGNNPGMRQNFSQNGGGMGPMGGMTGLFNFQRGAEAIEVALVRIGYRLNLTAEQQPLFDQMRTTVVDAVRKYIADTAQVRSERSTPTAPLTLPDLLQRRIVIENAQLEALTSVVPSVTAFYESLTPQQQSMLTPLQRGQRGGGNWGGQGSGNDQSGPSEQDGQSGAQPDAAPPANQPPSPQMGDQPPAPPSQPPAPPAAPADPAPPIRG